MGIRLVSDDKVEESCVEKLYMFLYKPQVHHCALELSQMFNAHMSLENMIKCNCFVLIDREHEYEIVVSGNVVVMSDGERYVHPNDFAIEKILKNKVSLL